MSATTDRLQHMIDSHNTGAYRDSEAAANLGEMVALVSTLLATQPKVQVIHSRDADSACGLRVFVDDVEIAHEEEDIDPGRGWSRSEWYERIEGYDGDDTAFGKAARNELASEGDSQYITDDQED